MSVPINFEHITVKILIMNKVMKMGVMACFALSLGVLTSCKDKEEIDDSEMTEMEVSTEEELTTTATDTSLTRSESNEPGVTSGSMEQVP